jgi:hypothetical protein
VTNEDSVAKAKLAAAQYCAYKFDQFKVVREFWTIDEIVARGKELGMW